VEPFLSQLSLIFLLFDLGLPPPRRSAHSMLAPVCVSYNELFVMGMNYLYNVMQAAVLHIEEFSALCCSQQRVAYTTRL
jgi:hypothetical protein